MTNSLQTNDAKKHLFEALWPAVLLRSYGLQTRPIAFECDGTESVKVLDIPRTVFNTRVIPVVQPFIVQGSIVLGCASLLMCGKQATRKC